MVAASEIPADLESVSGVRLLPPASEAKLAAFEMRHGMGDGPARVAPLSFDAWFPFWARDALGASLPAPRWPSIRPRRPESS